MKLLIYGGPDQVARICALYLAAQGHAPEVMVSTDAQAGCYEGTGLSVRRGSVFQIQDLEQGMKDKEIAIFFGTDMPDDAMPSADVMKPFDRVRREGARSFMTAALRQRVPLVILVSSVAVYGDAGDRWVDETAPLQAPPVVRSFVDMEGILGQGSTFQGLRHVILRTGAIYSAHTTYLQKLFSAVESGKTPPLAGENNFVSPVHVTDFAEALGSAVKYAQPGAVLNVVDDAPVRINELMARTALGMGAKPPGGLPGFMLRLALGKDAYKLLKTSCRASNGRAKTALKWAPQHPSILDRINAEIDLWREKYGRGRIPEGGPAPVGEQA